MKSLSLIGSKVIGKVKVDNRQTNKQTGQKQYAPNHPIRGHKNANTQMPLSLTSKHVPIRRTSTCSPYDRTLVWCGPALFQLYRDRTYSTVSKFWLMPWGSFMCLFYPDTGTTVPEAPCNWKQTDYNSKLCIWISIMFIVSENLKPEVN